VDDDDDTVVDDDDTVIDDDDTVIDDDDTGPDSCAADSFEPNDTDAAAAPITIGSHPGLTACPTDVDDWYAVTLAAGDELTVDLFFANAEGDIDLGVYDPTGSTLGTGISTDDDETVGPVTATTSGDHLVQVQLYADSGSVDGNTYDLELTLGTTATCPPDAFEPNDSDGVAAAVVAGTHVGLTACDTEDDWYAIDLAAGDELTVELLFANAEGDIDLELVDPLGFNLGAATSSDDDELLGPVVATNAGEHLVHVTLYADAGSVPGNTYDMVLTIAGAPTCAPDGFEPNDAEGSAVPITAGSHTGLTACDTDLHDWYALPLVAGDELTVDVFFLDAEGDIDLEVFDPSGSSLGSGTSMDDDESVGPVLASSTGDHLVHVELYADAGSLPGNSYDMDLTVVPFVATCAADGFEPNDTDTAAVTITPGSHPGLTACPDDGWDWYAVPLVTGETIDVQLTFSHAEGDIDLEVFDPAGASLGGSWTSDDDESAGTFTAATDGDHLVAVELYADTGSVPGNSYDMTVNVGGAPICTPDALEPNDSEATAVVLTAGSQTGLTACDTDDDWYAIDLAPGDELTVELAFANAEGDIDAELFDPSGASLGMGNSMTDDESIGPITAAAAGLHTIQVLLFGDSGSVPGNPYDLELTVASAVCVDDGYEPNDTQGDAFLLAAGSHPGLALCDTSSDDWFAVDLAMGDELTTALTFDNGEGDIDVQVLDPSGTVLDGGYSVNDDELVGPITAAVAGEHLVHTWLVDDPGLPGNPYDLELTVVAATCADDGYEPNDSESAAVALTAGSYPGLAVCDTSTHDFWAIDLVEAAELTVALTFSHAEGDIDVSVDDPSGSWVGGAYSMNDDELVGPITAAVAGTYVIDVYLLTDAGLPGNDYDMELTVVDPSCAADAYEPNDTEAAAVSLTAGSYPDLTACDTDEHDWYAIDLDLAAELTVGLTFVDAEGDIDVQVLSPGGDVLGGGYTMTDDEDTGPLLVDEAGTHLVHVYLYADAGGLPGNDYDMDLSVVMTCLVDEFEANDSQAAAAPIPSATFDQLAVCPTEDDWYSFLAGDGDLIEVDVYFADAEGDIDLTLWDPSGTDIAWSWSLTDDEAISATVTADGWYQAEVALYTDSGVVPGNTYEMDVLVTAADPDCATDDFFEDNDSDAAPATVEDNWYTNLHSCPSDEDWYALDVTAGQVVTVDTYFVDAEGDIDMYLYDETQTQVAYSLSVDDDESVSATASADGTWMVKVRLWSDSGSYTGNTYEMVIDLN